MSRLRRLYGSGPLHLLMMLVTLGIAGYAFVKLFGNPEPWSVVVWLVGAIIVHDFVFLPLYTGIYRLAWRAGRVADDKPRRIPIVHHVAVPAMISVLLLLAALPLVLRLSGANYRPTTGMTQDPFLWRWLGLVAALFAVSAIVYAVRRRRLGRAPRAEGAERAADEPAEGTTAP